MIVDTSITRDLSLVLVCEIALATVFCYNRSNNALGFVWCMEITAGKGQSQGLTQGVRGHIAVHVSWPSPANIYTHSSLRGGELWLSAAWLVGDPNVKWKFSRNSRTVKLVRQSVLQSQECNLLINLKLCKSAFSRVAFMSLARVTNIKEIKEFVCLF